MKQETGLTVAGREGTPQAPGAFLVRPETALAQLHELQAVVKDVMMQGEHYGVIPGTSKPTLLKPGAELLNNMYGYFLQDLEIVERVEQWDVPVGVATFPLFRFLVKAKLVNAQGFTVATGMGECNSYEAKYRWRNATRKCPTCGAAAIIQGKAEYGGGWVCFKKKDGCGAKFQANDGAITKQEVGRAPNEAIHDQINTLIKMAKKRAYVDATLSATRTSGTFTQDMEDFATLQEVTAEVIDTKTGEIKDKPAPEKPREIPLDETEIPVGPNKGKKIGDVARTTLENQLRWLQDHKDKYPEYRERLQRFMTTDAFGGIFDAATAPEAEHQERQGATGEPPATPMDLVDTAAGAMAAENPVQAKSRGNRTLLINAIDKLCNTKMAKATRHKKLGELDTIRSKLVNQGELLQEDDQAVMHYMDRLENVVEGGVQ